MKYDKIIKKIIKINYNIFAVFFVGFAYSDEFEVNVGVHQGSVRLPLLLATVVDVITEDARGVVINYCKQMALFS